MALKADRHELDVDISFFMNETAEKGQIVVFQQVGSGAAMDQAQALVTVAAADTTNIPVGVLLNDVVDLDLTRQHINFHKDEVQKEYCYPPPSRFLEDLKFSSGPLDQHQVALFV